MNNIQSQITTHDSPPLSITQNHHIDALNTSEEFEDSKLSQSLPQLLDISKFILINLFLIDENGVFACIY